MDSFRRSDSAPRFKTRLPQRNGVPSSQSSKNLHKTRLDDHLIRNKSRFLSENEPTTNDPQAASSYYKHFDFVFSAVGTTPKDTHNTSSHTLLHPTKQTDHSTITSPKSNHKKSTSTTPYIHKKDVKRLTVGRSTACTTTRHPSRRAVTTTQSGGGGASRGTSLNKVPCHGGVTIALSHGIDDTSAEVESNRGKQMMTPGAGKIGGNGHKRDRTPGTFGATLKEHIRAIDKKKVAKKKCSSSQKS
mmetsp:Transcript_43698/g.50252  ORF Transcript_43698/g.50252 Transcript_43698/m.50252 type:complete len:245 (-) Transcript_43698:72-806(-)